MIALGVFAVVAQLTCGSSVAVDREARNVGEIVRARSRHSVMATQSSRIENDFIVVPADETTAPFDDPADLEGISLFFKRRDASTFAVTREPLLYNDNVGDVLVSFGRESNTKSLRLSNFVFPFGARTYETLTFSATRGIHFSDTPSIPEAPFVAFEMLTSRTPLISPLYDYLGSPGSRPDVLYRETSSTLTITWRMQSPGVVDYDFQAVLFSTGDIRFSYKRVRNVAWGGVVLTTGEPDAWLSRRTAIVTASDPAGDVSATFGESAGMLDIVRAQLSRIDGSSMLELRIDLAAAIDREKLHPEASYLFFIGDSLNRVELLVRPESLLLRVPRGADLTNPGAVRIDGSRITILVTEELLALESRTVKVWVHTSAMQSADTLETVAGLGPVPERAETDFSAITSIETSRPLVESYGLPTVNLEGVWQRVKDDLRFSDETVDAVMVYTPFLTDIIQRPYGAFAMLSNPGVDGISQFSSRSRPRTTMLVNMNHLAAFGDNGTQVLLHEMGHRWLYYFEIVEDGVHTRSLNPLGFHPAQYVNTPAAFNVRTAADSSAMGGAALIQQGSNTFRTPRSGEWAHGYSWHELYLMGLASPGEVTGWWYLRDSDPPLGLEYYPPPDVFVEGKRVDVGVQQIIGAMGPRQPPLATSQKIFRVLFVVLERPGQRIAPPSSLIRTRFEDAFAKATGGRGSVVTSPSVGPRRRAVSP